MRCCATRINFNELASRACNYYPYSAFPYLNFKTAPSCSRCDELCLDYRVTARDIAALLHSSYRTGVIDSIRTP